MFSLVTESVHDKPHSVAVSTIHNLSKSNSEILSRRIRFWLDFRLSGIRPQSRADTGTKSERSKNLGLRYIWNKLY